MDLDSARKIISKLEENVSLVLIRFFHVESKSLNFSFLLQLSPI